MRKIDIKVIAGAKQNRVKVEAERLKVYVTAPALDGKANKAVIDVLALHFHVKPRCIEITKGLKSSLKTITIIDL